jgi:hypothetical protein
MPGNGQVLGGQQWSATASRLPRVKRGTRHLSAVPGRPIPSGRQPSCLPLSRRRLGSINSGPAAGRKGVTPPPAGRFSVRAYLLRRHRRRRFPDGSLVTTGTGISRGRPRRAPATPAAKTRGIVTSPAARVGLRVARHSRSSPPGLPPTRRRLHLVLVRSWLVRVGVFPPSS